MLPVEANNIFNVGDLVDDVGDLIDEVHECFSYAFLMGHAGQAERII